MDTALLFLIRRFMCTAALIETFPHFLSISTLNKHSKFALVLLTAESKNFMKSQDSTSQVCHLLEQSTLVLVCMRASFPIMGHSIDDDTLIAAVVFAVFFVILAGSTIVALFCIYSAYKRKLLQQQRKSSISSTPLQHSSRYVKSSASLSSEPTQLPLKKGFSSLFK